MGRRAKKSHQIYVYFVLHAHLDLQIISSDISELQKNQATTVAKIAQYKRKLMDLSHRVLQVCNIAQQRFAVGFLFFLKSTNLWPLFIPSVTSEVPHQSFSELPLVLRCVLVFFCHSSPFVLPSASWQVLIKQEIQRKSGYAIQVDEEHLRVQLDTIQSELNAPTQFKVSV